MSGPAGFTITKTYKIDGGLWTKGKRDIADVITVGGMDLAPLSYNNRNLVPLLIRNGTNSRGRPERWPQGLLTELKKARNDHVDALIKEHLRAGDPMCEADAQVSSQTEKERIVLFHNAGVPHVITLSMPAFSTDSGERVEPLNLTILSTHKKHKQVHVQLTSANFTWLAYACHRTYAHDEPMYDSEDESERIESYRHMIPPKVHLGINPRTKQSWFLRCYSKRKMKQVTFNYSLDDTDDDIKTRLEVALTNLHKKAGIETV